MAKKSATEGKPRRSPYLFAKMLCNVTIIVACMVLFLGGIQEGVRISRIIYHCIGVSVVIGCAFWAVIRAMASYEEINGGKA